MPTLIRLVITLAFLAGLAYAGMFALVAFVEVTPKETTVRIPTRDLLGEGATGLPGQQPAAPAVPAPAVPAAPATTEPVAPATTVPVTPTP